MNTGSRNYRLTRKRKRSEPDGQSKDRQIGSQESARRRIFIGRSGSILSHRSCARTAANSKRRKNILSLNYSRRKIYAARFIATLLQATVITRWKKWRRLLRISDSNTWGSPNIARARCRRTESTRRN